MLGDWVNLMGHQKAAYELLTRLYTPETIIQSALLRKVLLWYTRFDMFIGFQSGGDAILGREWYVTVYDYYKEEARKDPDNLPLKYEERFAFTRLVAKEQSNLFSRKAKGLLTDAEFMEELPRLAEIVSTMDKNIDPVLMDPDEMVTTLVGEPEPEDIVNPYEPKAIWGGSRWASNFLLIDQYAIIFMFHVQVSMAMRTPPDPALTEKALRTAQIFEAVCEYPKGPPGAILEAQACLAIATFFLPKDPKTTMWLRRSFAKIENAGYVFSLHFPLTARVHHLDFPCAYFHMHQLKINILFNAMLTSNLATSTPMSSGNACSKPGESNTLTGGSPTEKAAAPSSAP